MFVGKSYAHLDQGLGKHFIPERGGLEKLPEVAVPPEALKL